ncbi:hypothetical protein Esti_003085 [Eimeria stiedai]
MECVPAALGPTAALASTSSEASQENDQVQARGPFGAPLLAKRGRALGKRGPRGSRGRGAGAHRLSLKSRPKVKAALACTSSGVPPCSSFKFVSPEAVVEAARRVKDRLPDVSEELLASLKARGLEPCTLQEVLDERKLQWAVTQARDERAEAEHTRLLQAFQQQCEGWGNNREGWVHSRWHSVIVCPDFKRGGLQVSRSTMREAWNSIMSVVNGFVCPDLLICRVTDPTHPVRFATPPGESCYTVVYAGKEPIKAARERKILGEYTGRVRAGIKDEHRFEYVFDLSFCALAWRAAEEYEQDSDTSADEGSASKQKETSSLLPISVDAFKNKGKDRAAREAEAEPSNEGKRRVQVTGSHNIKRVALPVRGELVLDSHDACNQMSLVNHYGTIGLLGERICHVNTEWQQVFVDGWPHVVLTTIPGVTIEPGDEVLADFGYDWFNRVQDASHKAIARELLDYRIGAKKGGCQTLPPGRKAECVVRDSDLSLQTRARVGEVCPYCHSDEIPNVPSSSSDLEAKSVHGEGGGAASRERKSSKSQPLSKAEDSEGARTASAAKHGVWGEQVVHCDGCDRPCHLRCIFGAHSADLQQQQTEQQEQPHEQQEGEQLFSSSHAVEGTCSAPPRGGGPAAFGAVTPGECVEDVYRWFLEGDCKWYCCVCRLQWERMAAAMNFSVDWKARRVLGAGNPLLLRGASEAAAGGQRAAVPEGRCVGEQRPHDRPPFEHSVDRDGSAFKRRGRGGKRGSVLRGGTAKRSRADAPQLPRRVKGVYGGEAEQGVSGAPPLALKAEGEGPMLEGPAPQDMLMDASCSAAVGVADASLAPRIAEAASCALSESKSSTSGETLEGVQAKTRRTATSEGVAGLSTAAPESPVSGVDSDAQPKSSGDPGFEQSAADADTSSLGKKPASAIKASQRSRSQAGSHESEEGLVVEEALRVYRNSSERARTSNMQPCPVALNPAELTAEELLGCRTEMLVEPRALLGALQPCVRCYELYGSKASVEVCRLTKRHLASNWDHPDFASPVQIQDALLTCFQDALLTLQREHREKLQEVLESMGSFQRDVNLGTLLAGNRYPRIHANAARRSEDTARHPGINATPKITKGVIPLLAVTLGKTMVDYKHPDPETKKLRWYHGCVSDYQAIAPEEVDEKQRKRKASNSHNVQEKKTVYFTNQFGINYDDGDRETVPADRLIEMLIETGAGSKLDGRKVISTTPLAKMLAPELKMAIRRTNRIVRETNRKGVLTDSDSDEE